MLKYLGALILTFFIVPFAFPQENITIATYYPAPFGVYEELRSRRMAIGENYVDGAQFCWPPNICTEQIDADTDLVVEGNVGIGTVTPREKLEVTDGRILLRSVTDVSPSNASLMFQNLLGHRWHIGINDTLDSLSIADTLEQNVITLRNMDGNRNVGIGNSLPQAKLDVNGGVRVGDTNNCSPSNPGTIRYHNNMLEYCDGTNWVSAMPPLAIGSGNVFNGGFIPFPHYPDGSAAQLGECEWIVAPNATICTNTGSNCSGAQETDQLICSANVVGNRIQVHAYTQEHGDPPIHPYQVRYFIMCRK